MDWIAALEAYARAVDLSKQRGVLGFLARFRPPRLAVRGPHAAVIDAFVVNPTDPDAVLGLSQEGQIEAALSLILIPLGLTPDYRRDASCQGLVSRLLRRKLPWTPRTATALALCSGIALGHHPGSLPLPTVAKILETHGDSSEAFRVALSDGLESFATWTDTAAIRKHRAQLTRLLKPADTELAVSDGAWGAALKTWFANLSESETAHWRALLDHARTASGARPSKGWLKTAEGLLRPLPDFPEQLMLWFDSADLAPTVPHRPRGMAPGISDTERDLLKGLVFAAAAHDDTRLPGALATFGLGAYVKVPQVGAKSTKLGNAVVATLGLLPEARGAAHLTRMASKVRYAQARRLIERSLDTAAAAAGITRADVEQTTVPTFDLVDGRRACVVGAFTAVLSVDAEGVTLSWIKPNGKAQKTVPKVVKEEHPAILKQLKADRKQLLALIEAQRLRIESLWLKDWSTDVATLTAHYLDHPVVGVLAKRLLWEVEGEGAAWHAGALCDLGGQRVTAAATATVRLWHPLTADPDRQVIWRDRFESEAICQPFQQLWRPIYRASDDEAYDSIRFEGRVMHQHRLVDCCQRAGWRYQVQGMWDSLNDPEKSVPEAGLRIVLGSTPFEESDAMVFRYVISGPLTFTAAPDYGSPLPLTEIDPIVFSELMLQTEQLVSTCAVHTLPEGLPSDIRPEDLLFPPPTTLTHARARILERALPRTALSATVEGAWLVVEEARIHLDTAAVQVAGQHIPHPPNKKHIEAAKRVFLPHEGDPGLLTVLAQALALDRA